MCHKWPQRGAMWDLQLMHQLTSNQLGSRAPRSSKSQQGLGRQWRCLTSRLLLVALLLVLLLVLLLPQLLAVQLRALPLKLSVPAEMWSLLQLHLLLQLTMLLLPHRQARRWSRLRLLQPLL